MLERRFKNLAGLEDFSADLMGQRLHVKYDAAKLTASAIADAVAETGMRAWLEHEEPIALGGETARRRRMFVAISGVALSARPAPGIHWAAAALPATSCLSRLSRPDWPPSGAAPSAPCARGPSTSMSSW